MKNVPLFAILLIAWLSSCQKTAEVFPLNLEDTIQNVPYLSMAQLRSGAADNRDVVFITAGEQSGAFQLDPSDTSTPDDSAMTLVSGARRYKRIATYATLEMFGATGDYDYITKTGTDNTAKIQKALNYCAVTGMEIKLLAGKKYLTHTLYLYKDSLKNPQYAARPGRVKISGQAGGIATGSLEPQGAALVHMSNDTGRLIECIGSFSISSPASMGGQIHFENMNFVGGNRTKDVIYFEACQGQISMDNYTVQINNPAGNGITEVTTWETEHHNGLIRGQAAGTGSWTGIGLNIRSNESDGQVNMKIYSNVNVYKCGYGIRIGRRNATYGTIGPLNFIGGQVSLSDQHNMWLDGGAYNLVSTGQQFEGSRLNAILIDSDGANDLPRNIKFINTYFTGGGRIEDDSYNSFAVHIKDGVGVEFDSPLFNNLGCGIVFNKALTQGLVIRRPIVRTVRAYGATNGIFIDAYGSNVASNRLSLEDPVFNQAPATYISEAALQAFLTTAAGGRLSVNNNAAVVSCSMGGGTLQAAQILNFNNSAATTITNITGGQLYRELLLTFSNSLTKIAHNSNIFLSDGLEFSPTSRSTLKLIWMGSYWVEVSRS
ncbi:hypothetical protein [Chitinophaga alhagiae]|uniref:hypothetical protein n=1 Tax=Chitinophaga alhagiae TaxID=2203219 RepID=UPI000E5A4662|nr:hypothetical protein [Chitinophaga alhagiae]